MSRLAAALAVAALAATAAVVPAQLAPAADAPRSVRAAVEASLPLLQSSGEEWYESRSCSSCHHTALNLTAVSDARDRGFAVDVELTARLLKRWSRSSAANEAAIVQGEAGINAQIGQSYRLLALAASDVPPNSTTAANVHFLAGKQQRDGHWRSESHRPPHEDSEFTATALAARAISLYAPPGRADELAQRVRRAHAWLATAVPRDTEDRVMRLFGLAWTGGTPEELAAASAELLGTQRADGGWAQIPTRESDAYATGQALVALHHAGGLSLGGPAGQRGIEFLLRTQLADGTWHVATRRKAGGLEYFETGFPHGEDQFISYAGTAWALSALCAADETTPPPPSRWLRAAPFARGSAPRDAAAGDAAARAAPADDAVAGAEAAAPLAAVAAPTPEDGLTPLIRAALHGHVDEVAALLAAGADPDEAGEGGLTALIAAAGQPEKARLLLEHGADVGARTQLDLTPLLAAAAADGGLPTLKLLLARRAAAQPEAEAASGTSDANAEHSARSAPTAPTAPAQGAEAANIERTAEASHSATDLDQALHLAALGGDAEKVDLLLAAGARIDARAESGETALMLAAYQGDAAMIRHLVTRGADPDADHDGVTALIITVIDGQNAAALALLELGADPDARDGGPDGPTPLHWAANVDFGDTVLLEALLACGVDVNARAGNGDTALRIAERHGHRSAAELLRQAGATE